MSTGNVVEVIGAVVDVEFARDAVPNVYDALLVPEQEGLTLEVQQQLGDGIVRTIAMGASEGLRRGTHADSNEERGGDKGLSGAGGGDELEDAAQHHAPEGEHTAEAEGRLGHQNAELLRALRSTASGDG